VVVHPAHARSIQIIFLSTLLLLVGRPALASDWPNLPPPVVEAHAWVLMDHDSGQILAAQNGDTLLPPTNLTQLMTAYVLFSKLKSKTMRLDDKIIISPQAIAVKGARLFVQPGESVRTEELLKGMIVAGANDAATALAERSSQTTQQFVAEMNEMAISLALHQTHFRNPTGVDEDGHETTALDLARLISALIRDFPELYKLYSIKEFSYHGITHYNRNAMLWQENYIDGVLAVQSRTGAYSLSTSAKRDAMRLITVVLSARSEATRVQSTQRLLNYGFEHFETRLLYAANVPALNVRLWMGSQSSLPIGLNHNLYLTLPRGWHDRLHARLTVPETPAAPIEKGQKLGTLTLELDDKPYADYPLVALQSVATGNFLQRSIDKLQLWLQ